MLVPEPVGATLTCALIYWVVVAKKFASAVSAAGTGEPVPFMSAIISVQVAVSVPSVQDFSVMFAPVPVLSSFV